MTASTRAFSIGVISLLALVLALSLAIPAANAQESASDVEFAFEGWWLRFREPLSDVPAGGGIGLPDDTTEIPRATVRDQTNPYRGEFTRVGSFPGDEGDEAMAGFEFDLFDLGGGAAEAQITGGTVTFPAAPPESQPQAGDGANGQRNEAAAAMIACPATQTFAPDFAGNWEDRPPVDTESCSPLELLDEGEWVQERPTWTLDLEPLVATWSEENFGFLVMPDPEREGDGSLFHVAFKTNLNQIEELEDFPVPTAELTYEVEELDIPGFGDADGGDLPGFDAPETQASGDAGFSNGGGGFDDGGADGGSAGFSDGGGSESFGGSAEAPLAADGDAIESDDEPQVADGEDLDDGAGATGGADTPLAADAEEQGGMNLGYLLVPLLGLGLAGTLGYSLSKDPELALEREGAVSKLMQRRQAQGATGASRDV